MIETANSWLLGPIPIIGFLVGIFLTIRIIQERSGASKDVVFSAALLLHPGITTFVVYLLGYQKTSAMSGWVFNCGIALSALIMLGLITFFEKLSGKNILKRLTLDELRYFSSPRVLKAFFFLLGLMLVVEVIGYFSLPFEEHTTECGAGLGCAFHFGFGGLGGLGPFAAIMFLLGSFCSGIVGFLIGLTREKFGHHPKDSNLPP